MDYTANTQANIKINNQKIILQLLVNEGPMSRAELAKKMNSSKPTISKNVEGLLNENKIVEIGKDDNLVGKKGILLDINADYGYILAIDLSKNKFSIVVSNLKKEWIHYHNESLDRFFEDDQTKVDILEILIEFIKDNHINMDMILLVSIAYPGVIGHNDSVYLTNLKFKETLLNQLKLYIKNVLHKKLIIKNDVNLSTICEKRYGRYSDVGNLYLLSADVGVGVGIIINHELYAGDRNAAGEVGFVLPIQRKDGHYYTLEDRVSLHALEKRYSELKGNRMNYNQLMADIESGQELATSIYMDILEDVSVAITNIASILDIKTVVLDGRLFDIKCSMIDDLNEKINSMTPFETVVTKTVLDKMAIKGAIVVGVETIIDGLVK